MQNGQLQEEITKLRAENQRTNSALEAAEKDKQNLLKLFEAKSYQRAACGGPVTS